MKKSHIVPQQILDMWGNLYQVGDISAIQKVLLDQGKDFNAETIRVVVRRGETRNLAVLEAVTNFYSARAAEIKAIHEKMKETARMVEEGMPTTDTRFEPEEVPASVPIPEPISEGPRPKADTEDVSKSNLIKLRQELKYKK